VVVRLLMVFVDLPEKYSDDPLPPVLNPGDDIVFLFGDVRNWRRN